MTEQHTAPASAKREYRANPLSFAGDWALAFWMAASTLGRPVVEGGGEVAILRLKDCLEIRVDDYYLYVVFDPKKNQELPRLVANPVGKNRATVLGTGDLRR